MALAEHPHSLFHHTIPIPTHVLSFRMQKTAAAEIQGEVWQRTLNTAINFLSIHQYFIADY